jgi:hypothetical protein
MDVNGQLHGLAALIDGEDLRYPSKTDFVIPRQSENGEKHKNDLLLPGIEPLSFSCPARAKSLQRLRHT